MNLRNALLSLLPGLLVVGATEQQPLGSQEFNLIKELQKAEIIPTVFDSFHPLLKLNVTWKKVSADVGHTIKPKKMSKPPYVQLLGELPDFTTSDFTTSDELPQLTLILTDPDARSRDNPDWSEMCHWIATNISLTTSMSINADEEQTWDEIVEYKPPGPPPKTGKHRYVFAALAPKNGTTERLYLSKPKERQHWGYGKERHGIRQWAEENGLGVVGANFVYAEDKKQ
ncbi:related to putative lipid binding protein TFS1 [Ramularia collo-cygni]|uniref:Related to putative lipid binding protein TFS1 n=1 Tax=Ramularia collo-cygni TaxID=112498 RepID=A0A2D3V7M9_9PEZI|nr:related to putative lipid binding protein TFS1 [Ramularia collo-cygni]CZT22910.1 related to putative lipid binding protein TFS1 [Ramularia collo-cygni]